MWIYTDTLNNNKDVAHIQVNLVFSHNCFVTDWLLLLLFGLMMMIWFST